MYRLRATHISWARQRVNADSVKLQVGHAPQDVEEKFYLSLVDARLSSKAVWDTLQKSRVALSHSEAMCPAIAVGAESMQGMDLELDHDARRAENARDIRPGGVEPSTSRFEAWRSIQLS